MKLKEYMNILNINDIDLSKVGRLRNIKINGLTDYGFIDFIKLNGLAISILNEKYNNSNIIVDIWKVLCSNGVRIKLLSKFIYHISKRNKNVSVKFINKLEDRYILKINNNMYLLEGNILYNIIHIKRLSILDLKKLFGVRFYNSYKILIDNIEIVKRYN